MNYRHGFHAGNFADVMKHALLARMLAHLKEKPAPFRVIDTHAGAGLYDLSGEEAERGGEWQGGIGRLETPFEPDVEALLTPYRTVLAEARSRGPALYPGSPFLIAAMAREGDRLSFNELHEATFLALRRRFGRDERAAVNRLDGWTALKAQVPPPERRGLVLIDPPFEQPGEFGRCEAALAMMARKWAGGLAALWYPVKADGAAEEFARALAGSGLRKLLRLELHVGRSVPGGRLAACGLVVMNPPWRLADEASRLLPALADRLALDDWAGWRVEWLAGED